MINRTFACVKDAWVLQQTNGSGSFGNSKGPYLHVGRVTGTSTDYKSRSILQFALDFSGNIFGVSGAWLRIRVAGAPCLAQGNNPRVIIQEISNFPSESGGDVASNCGFSSVNSAGWSDSDGGLETNEVDWSGSPSSGTWLRINIQPMLQAAFEAGKTNIRIRICAWNGSSLDESNNARRIAFHSRNGGSAPYLEMELNDNQPPNAPTDLSPAEDAVVGSTNGTSVTVSSRHTDPDGDAATRGQWQWWSAAATDDDEGVVTGGTLLKDNVVNQTVANNAIGSHTFTGLSTRTAGKWRMRWWDGNQWGPWSRLRGATTAFKASIVQPFVQTNTLTPDFFGTIQSNDPGDFWSGSEIEVMEDPTSGATITKWAPGKIDIGGEPTRFQERYGGTDLRFDPPTTYRWRARGYNRDGVVTDWTAWMFWTPTETTGPDTVTPSNGEKQNTRTPTISWTHGQNFDQWRVRIFRGDVEIHNSGVQTVSPTDNDDYEVPASVLNWGDTTTTFTIELRIDGNTGFEPASPRYPLIINTLPGQPQVTVLDAVQRNGVWIVPTETPTISAVMVDADDNSPAGKEVEIREAASPAGSGTLVAQISTASPVTQDEALPSSTVEFEDSFDIGIRHRDGALPRFETQLAANSSASATNVKLDSVDGLAPGDQITIITNDAIETRVIQTVGTAGSGGTGVDVTEAFTHAHAENDDVKIFWWGQRRWIVLKPSEPPAVAITSPADEATVTDPTITVTHTFSSPGGKAQASRELVAIVGGNEIYRSGQIAGTGLSTTLPPFLFSDAEQEITLELTACDTDGLCTTATAVTVDSEFAAPAALASVTATPDLDVDALLIEWSASELTDDEFHAYRVFARSGSGSFEQIAFVTAKATTSFLWPGVPHNSDIVIRVVQTNGFADSDPIETEARMDRRGVWAVRPDEAIEIRHVKFGQFSGGEAILDEEFQPEGRSHKLRVLWDRYGFEGSFSVLVRPDERVILDRLRSWHRNGTVVALKTPDSAVRFVQVIDLKVTDDKAELKAATVSVLEVGRDAADF